MPPTPQQPYPAQPSAGSSNDSAGLSLQALVTRHLQAPDEAPTATVSAKVKPSFVVGFGTASGQATTGAPIAGQQLNAVDTQWAAGIEQLLPTPAFRLRVMKERMVRERKEMHAQYKQYQAINTTTARHQAKLLRQKLLILARHEANVDRDLQLLMGGHSLLNPTSVGGLQTLRTLFETIHQAWQAFNRAVRIEYLIHRIDPLRGEMASLNTRLAELTTLTAQRLAPSRSEGSQTTSPLTAQELADVLTAYDETVAQLTQLQSQLPTTLWGQWRRLLWQR